jgi:hypothetical protein
MRWDVLEPGGRSEWRIAQKYPITAQWQDITTYVRILIYPIRQEIQLNDSNEISFHQLTDPNKWNNKKTGRPKINQTKNKRNQNTKLITERLFKISISGLDTYLSYSSWKSASAFLSTLIRSVPLVPGRQFPIIIVTTCFIFMWK